MSLAQKTNHSAEGQDQLITQFVRQPNFRALLDTWLTQIQEIEDALFQLLGVPENIAGQSGDVLDLIGKIVGQDREGRSDADYVNWILARLEVNRASGLPDELFSILSKVVTNPYEYEEFYPAAFVLRLVDAFSGDAADIASLLSEVRAAGVGAGLEYSTEDDADTFAFASADDVEYGETDGFAVEAGLGTEIANGDFSAWSSDDPVSWFLSVAEDANHEVSEVGSGEAHGGSGTGACSIWSGGVSGMGIFQTASGLTASSEYVLTVGVSYFSGTSLTIEVKDVPGLALIASLTVTAAGTYYLPFVPTGTQVQVKLSVAVSSESTVDSAQALVASGSGGVFADVEEI